jgi:hypothetical protein
LAASALLLAASALAQAGSASSGWTVTRNVSVDSGDTSRRTSIAMRQQVTARYLRHEFVRASGFSGIEGMYTIIDAVDSTMTMVMPSEHTATVMGFELLGPVNTTRVSVSEWHLTRSDLEDLGDGGRLLGHATRHYRLTIAGTADLLLGSETCTSRVDGVSDMWIAPDVDFGPASEAGLKHLGLVAGTTTLAQRGVPPVPMPKGAALRTVYRNIAQDSSGKDVTVTMTNEIVELAHTDLDASLFTVPPDVRTMDMRKMMADSAMKASATAAAKAAKKAMCHPGGT